MRSLNGGERRVGTRGRRAPTRLPWLPGGGFGVAAAAVLAVQAVWVLWLVVPGGLYVDDLRAQAYAVDRPLWPFVVESNRTHFSPGARTVDWVQAAVWPLEHWPAVVVTLLVDVGLGVAVWRLLTLLVESRGWALLGLGLTLFSASLVPALAWYRQALTTLTALLAVVVALDAALRFSRGGPARSAAVAVAASPLGLAFSERALILPVVVAAGCLLLSPATPIRPRLARTALVVAPMVLVNLAFLAVYLSGDFDRATSSAPTVSSFLLSTGRSLLVNAVPALLGGPLLWAPGEPAYAYAATPVPLVVLGAAAVVAVVIGARRAPAARRRTAGRVALVALAYALPLYCLVYVGRISRASVTSVDDLRLYPDVGVFVALALTSALAAAVPQTRLRRHHLVAAGVAGAAVLLGCAVSWSGFARRWHSSQTPAYVAALRSELLRNGATVVPGLVPPTVVPGWVQPDFSTGSLVRLLHPGTELTVLDGPGVVVDARGRLRPFRSTVLGRTRRDTATGFCGALLNPRQNEVRLPFASPVPYYRGSLLEVRALVADRTVLAVQVVDTQGRRHDVRWFSRPSLLYGPHTLVVPVPTSVRIAAVSVSRSSGGAPVCVPQASVLLPEGPT